MEESREVETENISASEDKPQITLFGGLFCLGEEVSLKGLKFRITKVTQKKLTLRLISRGL